jgi:hypothetical protein
MTPSVGRIVHYQAHGSPDGTHRSVPRAAVVTEVLSDTQVSICVLNPTGMYFDRAVDLDESATPRGGTWHWPPRSP